jgi:hypothetical protein
MESVEQNLIESCEARSSFMGVEAGMDAGSSKLVQLHVFFDIVE